MVKSETEATGQSGAFDMKPPMHQKIWFNTQVDNGETDRYGKPILSDVEVQYKARVRRKTNEITSSDGSIHNTNLEIDVPAYADVRSRQSIHYENIDGTVGKGTIESIEDSVNLSGNRVFFKVLMVDAQ